MSLQIAQLGQPILRNVAAEVPIDQITNSTFQDFLNEMLATLHQEKGAGLAAPQVFVGLRVFLAAIHPPSAEDESRGVEIMINPKIAPIGDERRSAWEGCLSFPELLVLVPRPRAVRIEYLSSDGIAMSAELHGFAARVVQHEFDHLEGILTIDRAASTQDIVKASEIAAVREARSKS